MSWHADPTMLAGYRSGTLAAVHAASLEAHLLSCAACRSEMSAVVGTHDGDRLDRLWTEIVEVADGPAPTPVERLLRRVGVRDHVARLLAATPSLQLSWLASLAAVLGIAVVMAHAGDGEVGRLVFLVLAPALPVAGVAAAFGPRVDPAHEVAVASPMHGLSLLLVRSVAVVGVTMVIAAVASVALPGAGWQAAAWLLPALALTMTTLALATWWAPLTAAATTTGGWAAITLVAHRGRHATAGLDDHLVDRMLAFRPAGQLLFLVVTLAAAAVLANRRDTLELGRLT